MTESTWFSFNLVLSIYSQLLINTFHDMLITNANYSQLITYINIIFGEKSPLNGENSNSYILIFWQTNKWLNKHDKRLMIIYLKN